MVDKIEIDLSPENLQRFFDTNANEAAAGDDQQSASPQLTGAERYKAILSEEDRRLAEQLDRGRTITPVPMALQLRQKSPGIAQPRPTTKRAKQSRKSKKPDLPISPAGEDIEGAMNLQRLNQPPQYSASPLTRHKIAKPLLFRPPQEQATIAHMRKDRALHQTLIHFGQHGTTFLAAEAKNGNLQADKARQANIAAELKSPAVQEPEHPYFAARNAPLADTITTTAPVIAQALQHLDNLSHSLRSSEAEACDREEDLAKMLVRARRVREDATAWRIRGGDAIGQRRAEVNSLIGLEPRELDAVEGWEEILRPLVLREGRR